MSEEKPAAEQHEPKKEPAAKGGMMKNLLIFGVPAFLVQFVLIYFLTAKFVVPLTMHNTATNVAEHGKSDKHDAKGEEKPEVEATEEGEAKEPNIYIVKDMIINPAGTNGQRYLLTTIAFNVTTEETLKEIEKKEMAIRDMLNSILTSKSMDQLIDVVQREKLRQEITTGVQALITSGTLSSVYFSKYIIQ